MNKYYINFFGIDIAKDEIVVALHGQKKTRSYTNDSQGFVSFTKHYGANLSRAFVVFETTGGYEWDLMMFLKEQHLDFHRADTLKVKRFLKSIRLFGKTDRIDALGLALYASERHASLPIFAAKDERQLQLQLFVRRRDELVKMRTQELNRSQSPMCKLLSRATSFSNVLAVLDEEIAAIEEIIRQSIESDADCAKKKSIMIQMPGVGEATAGKLLALLPELGSVTRRGIASMAGLAPHPYDSGKITGYRKTRGGRPDVKQAMFMAALSASKSKCALGDYYRKLVENGKKKIVAMVALMRKMIVRLNAQIRDLQHEKEVLRPV